MVSGTSGDVIQPPPGWTGAPADSASRHGEEEVRARGWRCRRSACAVQAGYDHAGILRRLAGSAHLFVAGAAPCARGRPPTRWSPRAGRRAHRAPSSRLHPRALATARAYQRLARPMPVAAAAARSAIVGYRRVRHVVVVRGLMPMTNGRYSFCYQIPPFVIKFRTLCTPTCTLCVLHVLHVVLRT